MPYKESNNSNSFFFFSRHIEFNIILSYLLNDERVTDKEIQWLEAFAKKHEFFASFLLHYNLKQFLSNNQYYWLRLHIKQAEEHGDTLLTTKEITSFTIDQYLGHL